MKLKDLINHAAGYSTITRIDIRYHLMPIESIPFPRCLCDSLESYNTYANCRLNSFAIIHDAIRASIDYPDLEDPAKAKIIIRYSFKRAEITLTPPTVLTFRCITKRQADHVLAYIKSKSDTYILLGIDNYGDKEESQ